MYILTRMIFKQVISISDGFGESLELKQELLIFGSLVKSPNFAE